ncbi:hypothetical protein CVT26_002476 [Gymnopilus dilepis]|uniref:XPG-I domain-containing protein n=1 Tax=Gymnopilus dilepis TaxID=231916 RepID=A0A409Y3N7_9AGAR|nr:hypothetical protein CVT26_002476 [Gymnopilus dilepis]
MNGYCFETRKEKIFKVGIDISIMMTECIAVAKAANLHSSTQGGPIRVLFFRLSKLARLPILAWFVFDGRNRPTYKRGARVSTEDPWWRPLCELLLKLFGFQFSQAPGEAEAELARMNKEGLVDAVMTSDSDAFAFGATCVLKRLPGSGEKYEHFRVYTLDALENEEKVKMSRGGSILFALLSGGDYSDGITGFGPEIAHALAQCGFGDVLLDNILQEAPADHSHYLLKAWKTRLQDELCNNSNGFLPGMRPQLAASLPESFPDMHVLNLYTHPITSWSEGHYGPDIPLKFGRTQEPDLDGIRDFCMTQFGWKDSILCKHLRKSVFEGAFNRMIFSVTRGTTTLNPWTKITLSTLGFVARANLVANCPELSSEQLDNLRSESITVWVPARYCVPTLVEFEREGASNEPRPRAPRRARRTRFNIQFTDLRCTPPPSIYDLADKIPENLDSDDSDELPPVGTAAFHPCFARRGHEDQAAESCSNSSTALNSQAGPSQPGFPVVIDLTGLDDE